MAAQREWFDKDYYKLLGVSKTASDKEITKAYRRLAKKFHPDANPGDRAAEDRFKEVSSAYDVLGDSAKRKEYDHVRSMAAAGAGFSPGQRSRAGAPFAGSQPFTGADGAAGGFHFEDLGDLFGGLFNRGGRQRGPGPQRGDDLETDLHLDFMDAVNGVTTAVNVTSDAACKTCRGSGAEPGTSPVTCPDCGGRGVLDDNQGVFSFSRPCPKCQGSGRIVEKPCKTCKGSGIQRRSRQVKVRMPAGVKNGQRIRLKGRGAAGRNGGPAGDLYVRVNVKRHPLFGRKGDDLAITVPVTYAELALGAAIRVPTLTTPVTVKVPAGTPSGKVLRVRGRGAPKRDGAGDLLVTLEVAIPKKLSADQRSAIETLAATNGGDDVRKHLKVGS